MEYVNKFEKWRGSCVLSYIYMVGHVYIYINISHENLQFYYSIHTINFKCTMDVNLYIAMS